MGKLFFNWLTRWTAGCCPPKSNSKTKKDQNKTAQFKSVTCNVVIEFLDLHKEKVFVVVDLNVNPLFKKLGEAQTLPGVILVVCAC